MIVDGTTSSPNNITSQWTGRTNSSLDVPHRILLGMGSLTRAVSTIAGNNSFADLPGSVDEKQSFSTPSFGARPKSAMATPQDLANPSAARVGLPSGSNAAFTAGPNFSVSLSACFASTAETNMANRRGVAKDFTSP